MKKILFFLMIIIGLFSYSIFIPVSACVGKLGISNFLLEGGKNLTELFIKSGFINQFFLFESNKLLKNHGQLKINNILNKLNKTFKKKLIVNTFVDKDRIIRYL